MYGEWFFDLLCAMPFVAAFLGGVWVAGCCVVAVLLAVLRVTVLGGCITILGYRS